MSTSSELTPLAGRFIRIVEIIKEKNKNGELIDAKTRFDTNVSLLFCSDRTMMHKIRTGHSQPSHRHIQKLAALFGIDYNAFYREVEEVFYREYDGLRKMEISYREEMSHLKIKLDETFTELQSCAHKYIGFLEEKLGAS